MYRCLYQGKIPRADTDTFQIKDLKFILLWEKIDTTLKIHICWAISTFYSNLQVLVAYNICSISKTQYKTIT